MVAKIVKASFPGHILTRPRTWQAPFIFASPHSGRHYPSRFLASSILDLPDLRRSEDAYVDTLLPDADDLGVPVLVARFPRAFVDVNRAANELDPGMFSSAQALSGISRSNRVIAGFGVIPKLAAAGRAIYGRRLPSTEATARMEMCYWPYHETLQSLIDECKSIFGMAIVIDWHSMPSTSANGQPLADIILGNRYGASCDSSICGPWQESFEEVNLNVRRNSPYAGGYVTTTYGRPLKGVHALQIEINRGLYLDENRTHRLGLPYRRLRDQIASAIGKVISGTLLPWRQAAE